MSRYWSAFVHDLQPYVPGEQPGNGGLIKLNTNENPYPPSEFVLDAIREAATGDLRLYPEPDSRRLKEVIAGYYGLTPGQIFMGNGSDEILAHVFHGLLKHDRPVLFPDISYAFYQVYCNLYQISHETVPLSADFRIEVADYLRPNGGIIFPNPNAPTGCLLALDEIERLLRGNPDSVVVVDEAYIDFGGVSAVGLINKFPNLLVVQTLSKSRSLAGLRVGFALGHVELIEGLEKVKNSFNSYPLDRLAAAGAAAAFKDQESFRRNCAAIISARERLSMQLQELGFAVLPSRANFIFVTHPGFDAAWLAAELRRQRILVRHFNRPRIEQYLRITIGSEPDCDQVAAALAAVCRR